MSEGAEEEEVRKGDAARLTFRNCAKGRNMVCSSLFGLESRREKGHLGPLIGTQHRDAQKQVEAAERAIGQADHQRKLQSPYSDKEEKWFACIRSQQ
ncbi:hypothetical protein NDU88_009536 [Pleurodeles waltl]|uniref:Uncharacterized protein n=1 Tax=Pleurodeles waltl TaxID=8319 RepID=A0AAV7PV90_PLEWA|nr:hypothetical protein NDU88_009536 [Pleurodeles waltl]